MVKLNYEIKTQKMSSLQDDKVIFMLLMIFPNRYFSDISSQVLEN